jgi:hypothetical protein
MNKKIEQLMKKRLFKETATCVTYRTDTGYELYMPCSPRWTLTDRNRAICIKGIRLNDPEFYLRAYNEIKVKYNF